MLDETEQLGPPLAGWGFTTWRSCRPVFGQLGREQISSLTEEPNKYEPGIAVILVIWTFVYHFMHFRLAF